MQRIHFAIAAILAVCLAPALHAAGIPFRFDWSAYFSFYVLATFQSVILAVALFDLGYPGEFHAAITGNPELRKRLSTIGLLGAYLFVVLLITFVYNDVIATFRFDGQADLLLNRVDAMLLHGRVVLDLSRKTPHFLFRFLEMIYTGMFPQIGACLFILAWREGRKRATQFIGAIATAYFIGLGCFYILPATGPYYLSVLHADGGYVMGGPGYAQLLNAFHDHRHLLTRVGIEYFMAFPCLHLTQAFIVLWFLRQSKRIFIALTVYDLVMVPAIVLLQQHYIVDLLGAIGLAVLAVAVVEPQKESASMRKKNQLYSIAKVSEGGLGQKQAIRELNAVGLEARPYHSPFVGQSGVQVFGGQRAQRKASRILFRR